MLKIYLQEMATANDVNTLVHAFSKIKYTKETMVATVISTEGYNTFQI